MSKAKFKHTTIAVSTEFHEELKLLKAVSGERSFEALLKRLVEYGERYQELANLTRTTLMEKGGLENE